MLVVVLSVVLCACAHGSVVNPHATPLTYRNYPGGGRYLFNPAPENWANASKICTLYNGHLVYPRSMDEANEIWKIMDSYGVSEIHAGFHDYFFEGVYIASGGNLVNESEFQQWTTGYPVGGTTFNCGAMSRAGIQDESCQVNYPSICEENQEGGNNNFKDYELVDGHGFFKLYNSFLRWPEALKRCYEDGAHMWVINSAEEHEAVYSWINNTGIDEVWVGAHQMFADRYFVTIFDQTLESTGFSLWSPGEPDGDWLSFPYVSVQRTGLRILGGPNPFVCEYNPESSGCM